MGKLRNLNSKLEDTTMLTDFLETYPSAQLVKQNLWELLIAAMGSEHADMWDGKLVQKNYFFMNKWKVL